VLRIHGVHSERRVLAKVITDLNHFFGCGDVMISVPANCPISDVYTIQHYVIKFDSLSFSSTNKTDRHDIIDVLLKVALHTLTLHNSIANNERTGSVRKV
jgi:hypothetical protein